MRDYNDQTVVYVDNFRGFEDTYIPLKDVNFLVGNNSTGKTSILSLINLLNNPVFWFKHDFSNDEVNLGSFKDIVNVDNDKKTFKIGILSCIKSLKAASKEEEVEESVEVALMTFYNKKGFPQILDYTYTSKNKIVLTKLAKNNQKIQYKVLPTLETDLLCPSDNFKQWIQAINSKLENGGFTNIPINSGFPSSLQLIQNIVDSAIVDSMKIGKDSSAGEKVHEFKLKMPIFNRNLGWIAPIRAKPLRTYDNYNVSPSPEGEHTPYLLKSMLSVKNSEQKENNLKLMNFFGTESGLFDSFEIKKFGKDATSPFEIDAVLNSVPFKISNVGYGVSQVLPIIVEILARKNNALFAIQQPEVHLHPRAQAALGDFIYTITTNEDKSFIIETHSEYLINRFRLNIHKHETEIKSQVLFFERKGNQNKVHIIDIENDGKYSENQPQSFTEFFINEELSLLEI